MGRERESYPYAKVHLTTQLLFVCADVIDMEKVTVTIRLG